MLHATYLLGVIILQKEHLGYYFKKINEAFVSRRNKALKESGLTSTQMDFLVYMFRHGETTQRELEVYFGLSHSTVIGIVQRLADKGYIVVEKCENDKRQRNLLLTEKAQQMKKDAVKRRENDQKKFEKYMTREEISNLTEELKKVYDILQKEEE